MALNTVPKIITKPPAGDIDGLHDVVATGTGFTVAWNRGTIAGGDQTILIQKFGPTGSPVSKLIKLDGPKAMTGRPELVDLGGNKVAAFWQSGGNVVGKVVDLEKGTAGPLKVIGETGDHTKDAVLLDNGRIALTLSQTDMSNIFAVREKVSLVVMDKNLNITKPVQSIHGNGFPADFINEFDHTVVDNANGGLVIFRDRVNEQIYAQKFSPLGALVGTANRINTTKMETPTIFTEVGFNVKATSLEGGKTAVAWTSFEKFQGSAQYDIRVRLLAPGGTALEKDILVNTSRAGSQTYPEIHALDNGGFAVTWLEDNFFAKLHMIRFFSSTGAAMSDAILTGTPASNSTTDDGSAVLADGSIVEVSGLFAPGVGLEADGIPKPVFGRAVADTMNGTGKPDMLIAGAGNDTVSGLAGDDVLDGMAGNDKLAGQAGADVLIGGAGRDTFVFNTAAFASAVDRILDFSVKDDTIQLDNAVFTKLKNGALPEAAFHIGNQAGDATDRIIYVKGDGTLLYDQDGSGAKKAVPFAIIGINLDVTASDFFVI